MRVHPIWSLTLQGKNTYENCNVNLFGSRGVCLSVQIRLLMTFGKIVYAELVNVHKTGE